MLRSAASKAIWLAKGAAIFWGALLTLALLFGVASMAFGADGQPFLLGKNNVASLLTKLTANRNGPAMQIVNNDAGTNAAALSLQVASGKPPMKVNSDQRVLNLNSDKLDGKNSTDLVPGGDVPAGTTISGYYDLEGTSPGVSGLIGSDSISFGYTLPSPPVLRFGGYAEIPPAECPGTSALPLAQPGYLCVYEGGHYNIADGYPVFSPVLAVGAGIHARSADTGEAFTKGSWAVTVPTAAQAAKLASQEKDGASRARR